MGYFDSVADFLAMGGHGPYVWSAYAVSMVVLVWLVLLPIVRRRRLLRQLQRQRRRAGFAVGAADRPQPSKSGT